MFGQRKWILKCYWKTEIVTGTEALKKWIWNTTINMGNGHEDSVQTVWSVTDEKDFSSSLCVQISSAPYPASYPMGTGGGVPFSGHDADH
jgi:hypothetical protein